MKSFKWKNVCLVGCLLLVSDFAQAQLLKGTVKSDCIKSIQIAYTSNGDVLSMEYYDMQPDKEGNFTFDVELANQWSDVGIYVDNEIFGARVEKGKTIHVHLEKKDQQTPASISFEGENAPQSRFYNAYSQTFDIMKYFSIDPAESKTADEYRQILEDGYAMLQKELTLLQDAEEVAYYTKLSKGMYTWTKIRILMDRAANENKKVSEYPEYQECIKGIDPNDEISVKTNLAFAWVAAQQTLEADYGGDMTEYYLETINLIEKHITNPTVRQSLTKSVGYNYFTFGNGNGDVQKFWNRYKEFAKNYPDLIAQYEPKVKALTQTGAGQPIPYDPVLTRADGTTCRLSDLFGKFIYIDVWATWCGPCCKEIPYLEKVVEQFKGNDAVRFVSISVDSNRNAWLKKIEKDQPSWEQYILSREEEKQFMKAWGIGGIPRFIMLDKEGKIFSADALRPSDEALIETIQSQL